MTLHSKNKERKPNIKRYSRKSENLNKSLLNAGKIEWVYTTKINSNSTYNMIDLFSGCGGLSLGFDMAGFSTLLGIDVDGGASASFRYNFLNSIQVEGRIENLSTEIVNILIKEKTVHVLCAGFPCPGFSIAGKKNDEDPRNYLYKEVVRLVKDINPYVIVLENVPRLASLEKFLYAIYNEFEDLGYNMSVLIHEAADYGTPQIRPRVIFIGNRFGEKNPRPIPMYDETNYMSIEKAIDDLKTIERNGKFNHEWTKHSKEMEKRISEVLPGGSLYESYYDAWKRQYRNMPSMTVKENHGGNHIHYELNRVLSAREMARLQGFPDTFIFEGTMKRVLFQIGNAVPVPLAKHIALGIKYLLEKQLGFNSSSQLTQSDLYDKIKTRKEVDIKNIRDVYANKEENIIIYYPVGNIKSGDILNLREKLTNNLYLKYIATELMLNNILTHKKNLTKKGCFRDTTWLDSSFNEIMMPRKLTKIKKELEIDSKWLSGGPRPTY